MKNTTVALLLGLAVASNIGCGSSSDSTGSGSSDSTSVPDFVALESKLTEPSGTFATGQEAAVQDAFGAQMTAAAGNPFGGTDGTATAQAAGRLSIQSLHTLDAQGSCAGLAGGGKGSCACPNGGTLEFDVPANIQGQPGENATGKIDQTVSIKANVCAMSANQTMDGSIYWKIKNPPLLQLFSVHLTITGLQAGKYDVEYLNKDGMITFAVDVADGRVLVSAKGNWDKATKTGTLVITDKNDTWTCTMTNGKGTCTSKTGATRQVGQ